MRGNDCRVLRKMDVRCSIFRLLLFYIMMVIRCSAKHLPMDTIRVELSSEMENDIQDSIGDFVHNGIYSHVHLDTAQLQVVSPVKVTREGELISHALEHAHEHGHARARRDLHATEHTLPHTLHYNLTIDGRDLRLDLRPSVTFITPALVVERHSAHGRTRTRPHASATSCHYTGSVRGQPNSNIAISACDGLAGLLLTEHGEYWIEPSNEIPTDGSTGRKHVIFKRSAVDKLEAFHRKKREVHSRTTSYNPLRNKNKEVSAENNLKRKANLRRNQKLAEDQRRRSYLEDRRRRLEAMRKDPVAYRRQKTKLRMEHRRVHSASKSISTESSDSLEPNARTTHRTPNRSNADPGSNRMRAKRRRRRRSKNCATKQPPYQWKTKNWQNYKHGDHNKSRNNKQNQRYHHQTDRLDTAGTKRSTRSVSKPRHVEVLLVADKSMSEFHNQGNLETYLLTIMNMVSSLYMDPSIGNYIKVVVVKIILVEEMQSAPELSVSTNADSTLASFCRWQHQLNPNNDEDPHHHDVAILVTRQDICSQHDTPCSTLGVAHVAGMCKPDRSCSVNEDNGIVLAHTITHELGHNFGLYHDTEKIGCHRREGSTLHIMTPIFEPDTVLVAWSRCSKRDVTNFLDAGLGECLSDRPSQEEPYEYPEVPAGVIFDAESQCHLQFGAEAVVCAKPSELCEHLWCLVNNTCKTMLRPAATGTTCGENMWCQNQTCVARTPSPEPRDGGWGAWSAWSACSRSCGAGVSTQSRLCDSPEPVNNGNYCIGDRSRYKVCNTEPCPINEPTFREVQCARFNNMTYNNETIPEWIPYIDQDKPCELECVPKNRNDVEMMGGFVADGTPCRQTLGARDMCIAGVCYDVGCDWVVGSKVEEDACGVCGGSGSECKTVQGIYNKDTTRTSGFSEVAVIPAGSRNVRIEEKVSPGNYISIGSAKSRKIYLNGARNVTVTEYFVAGAQAIYERDRDWEKVRISGPLTEDIKVYQRIFRGKHRNPGVTYQYTVDQPRRRLRYRLSEWSPCVPAPARSHASAPAAACGIGRMHRHYQCVDEHNREMELSQCYHIEQPRHEALMQQCWLPACTHWWVGSWRPCQPCHMPGEEAAKQRNVHCVNKLTNNVVDDSECDIALKPPSTIKCLDVPAC